LNALRGTNKGKTATPVQQIQILQRVRDLELTQPNISLSDPKILSLLNGTWYLQYTSPSTVELTDVPESVSGSSDDTPSPTSSSTSPSYDVWEPQNAALENVETQRFQARGTVSAAGITIDTSRNNALVQQIFNTDTSTVMNRIYFLNNPVNNNENDDNSDKNDDNNNNSQLKYAVAGGTYRPSTVQPNRAIVSFDTAQIRIPTQLSSWTMITIPLGWIFSIIAVFRQGNRDNGWLETTYIDTSLRIGRGNKGTMFILTREPLSLQ
jgi:hypothetical protein